MMQSSLLDSVERPIRLLQTIPTLLKNLRAGIGKRRNIYNVALTGV
jgi:hypothetical protein